MTTSGATSDDKVGIMTTQFSMQIGAIWQDTTTMTITLPYQCCSGVV